VNTQASAEVVKNTATYDFIFCEWYKKSPIDCPLFLTYDKDIDHTMGRLPQARQPGIASWAELRTLPDV